MIHDSATGSNVAAPAAAVEEESGSDFSTNER